jgi:hypothetical protein
MDTSYSSATIRVRVLALTEVVEGQAQEIIQDYERRGYECIEWSKVYPCKPPDEDRSIIYLSFVKGNGGIQHERESES